MKTRKEQAAIKEQLSDEWTESYIKKFEEILDILNQIAQDLSEIRRQMKEASANTTR